MMKIELSVSPEMVNQLAEKWTPCQGIRFHHKRDGSWDLHIANDLAAAQQADLEIAEGKRAPVPESQQVGETPRGSVPSGVPMTPQEVAARGGDTSGAAAASAAAGPILPPGALPPPNPNPTPASQPIEAGPAPCGGPNCAIVNGNELHGPGCPFIAAAQGMQEKTETKDNGEAPESGE